jgi:hypothetical protein
MCADLVDAPCGLLNRVRMFLLWRPIDFAHCTLI